MAIVLENYNGARKLIATGAPQQEIDDSVIAPDRMWSSKKLIEISTSQFETTGNPVAVSPFAYSPLGVKINFTPKQSGTGDPSPQNVRPITGYDEVSANVRGKNLLDVAFTIEEYNKNHPGTYELSEDGKVKVNAETPSNWATVFNEYHFSFPAGTWKLCCDMPTSIAYVQLGNISGALVSLYNQNEVEFSFEEETAVGIKYMVTTHKYPAEIGHVWIQPATPPVSYEPYQPGTTATLTLPETIYGGTVDAVTGVGSKEWDIVTLTSDFLATNTWTYGTSGNQTSPVIYGEIQMANDAVGDIYCTHFKRADSVPIENLEYWSDSPYFGYKRIAIRNDEWTSLETAKAWLDAQADAGTPVTVCYKLATLSAFTSDGYKTIQPLEGVNTIYSNTDSVTVSGRTSWINLMEGGN